MPSISTSLTKLLAGLAAGAITSFLLLYWHSKKQKQKSIEDQLSGSKKTKKNGNKDKEKIDSESQSKKDKESNEITIGKPSESTTILKDLPLDVQAVDWDITIPKDDVPYLIGKGGQTIKKIQKDTNTRILSKLTLPNGDRIYTIVGVPSAVELAENKITMHLMSQPVLSVTEITVPERVLGRLIGRSGENVRQMQTVSGARIDIPRIESSESDDFLEQVELAEDPLRTIKVRGSDEQISIAVKLINDTVHEELTLGKRIKDTAFSRTRRRNEPPTSMKRELSNSDSNEKLPVIASSSGFDPLPHKKFEVFVSCVYQPNEIWVQVVGPDSIKLDQLFESMTDYYARTAKEEVFNVCVGDIVAATFDVDAKMYRAKVLEIAKSEIEIMYVDYGDKKTVSIEDIRPLNPEFLKLRFQAREGSLNLECPDPEGKWSDEAISELVNLSFCAQWTPIEAKVITCIKDNSNNHEKLWLELYTRKGDSISEKLIAKGLAQVRDGNCNLNTTQNWPGTTTMIGSESQISSIKNGVSYASVVSKKNL